MAQLHEVQIVCWVINWCLKFFVELNYIFVSQLFKNCFLVRYFFKIFVYFFLVFTKSGTFVLVPFVRDLDIKVTVYTFYRNKFSCQFVKSKIYFSKRTSSDYFTTLVILGVCKRWSLGSLEWNTNLLFDLVYFNCFRTLSLIVISILRLFFHFQSDILKLIQLLIFHFFYMLSKIIINLFSFLNTLWSLYFGSSVMMEQIISGR